MAAGIPARLTQAEGRKFGLTVGIAFLVFAGVSRWRGHQTAPSVLAGLGAVLVLAALLIPARLGPIHQGWMRFGLALSKVTTPIFMALVYYVVLTPTGLLMRTFGKNSLAPPRQAETMWVRRQPRPDRKESLTRQF